jgi:hypothetical protein
MLPLRDYHPLRRAFPGASGRIRAGPRGSYYPRTALTARVWAVPLPLAATHGITVVFSSSAYLDVSVRRVRLPASAGISLAGWVAPFGHPRINPPCGSPRIFAAWHVLLRPVEPRHPPCALLYLLRAVPPFAGHGARRDPNPRIAPRQGARRIFGFSTSMNFPRAKPGKAKRSDGTAPAAARPERRCSSRTFRYGYLVTT